MPSAWELRLSCSVWCSVNLFHDPSAREVQRLAGVVLAVLKQVAYRAGHFLDGGDPIERDALEDRDLRFRIRRLLIT